MTGHSLLAPVHVGRVGNAEVRFFKGPSGKPELPWHSYEDLTRALGLPRDVRRQLLRLTQSQWPGELRTVATATGPVVIAPHCVAQGLLGGFVETGRAPAGIEGEYARAGGEALKVLAGDPPAMTGVAFALEAFHNTNGEGGDAA